MRGDDSLVSSLSIAARGEGPEGIANDIRCRDPVFGLQYGTVAAGKNLSFRHFSIGVTRFRPGFPKLLPKQPIGRTSRSLAPARDRCRRQITVMDFPSRCVRT